jgi:hypothetical protein
MKPKKQKKSKPQKGKKKLPRSSKAGRSQRPKQTKSKSLPQKMLKGKVKDGIKTTTGKASLNNSSKQKELSAAPSKKKGIDTQDREDFMRAKFRLCEVCDGHGWTAFKVENGVTRMFCKECNGTGKKKIFHSKKVPRKSSNILHKFTKLSPGQLERLKESGSSGAHLRYTSEGRLSLELVKRLELAKRKQPKYLLYSDQLGRRCYVGNRDIMAIVREEKPVTFDRTQAMVFTEGFDNEEQKIEYFNKLLNLKFQTTRL